ncbi:hypothetical protein SELMODRAFT_406621 [Selaginella moellendorffii]|uniref:Uncharacterized protein n=1 Tax=Selaginella moellendorffii TaxID=88036 RepID=D8R0X9_SELML|nr:hypothetical protein SELMODRAFT_406621 [Selaginella moellendorffii]
MWMLSQINLDATVIEAVGIGAPEATTTSGGVLVFDAGGGGGVVPLVVKAARGNIDKPTKEVIGSVVVQSTAEATKAVEATKSITTMWMLSQIDFDNTVIEAVGIDTAEATATGGGVLVFDAGGGGGVVPLAAKVARGNIDKPTKEVIGNVVVESTTEATKAVVTAPITP